MIRVIGEKLKQYEKNRSVEIVLREDVNLRKLYFVKKGIEYSGSIEDGNILTAKIPDALLMSIGTLTVRCEGISDDGIKTTEKASFVVHRAKKPDDYVEPEIDTTNGVSKEYVDNLFSEYVTEVAELLGGVEE